MFPSQMSLRFKDTWLGLLPADMFDTYFTHGYLATKMERLRGQVSTVALTRNEVCTHFDVDQDKLVVLNKSRQLICYNLLCNTVMGWWTIPATLSVNSVKFVNKDIRIMHTSGYISYTITGAVSSEMTHKYYASAIVSGRNAFVYYDSTGKRLSTCTSYGKTFVTSIPGDQDTIPADFGLQHLGISYTGHAVAVVNDKVYTKDHQSLWWAQVGSLVVEAGGHSPSMDDAGNIVLVTDVGLVVYDEVKKAARHLDIGVCARPKLVNSSIYYLDGEGELKIVS